jgi:hypothetical protein
VKETFGCASIAGRVETEGEPFSAVSTDEAKDQALFCLAGYAACLVAGCENVGFNTDFNDAYRLSTKWGSDLFEEWKSQAVEMMRTPQNRRAVELVAILLLERGTIEGEAIRECIFQSDANTPL